LPKAFKKILDNYLKLQQIKLDKFVAKVGRPQKFLYLRERLGSLVKISQNDKRTRPGKIFFWQGHDWGEGRDKTCLPQKS
jgi:hypothetical protein